MLLAGSFLPLWSLPVTDLIKQESPLVDCSCPIVSHNCQFVYGPLASNEEMNFFSNSIIEYLLSMYVSYLSQGVDYFTSSQSRIPYCYYY